MSTSILKLKERAMPGLHDHVMQLVQQTVVRGSKVLDIAAGTGVFTKRLKENGYDVSANEIDSDSWAYSDVIHLSYNLNFLFSENFKTSKVSPDAIIAIEVIEHLENPIGFLRECYSMLNKGGVLIVTSPNINTARGRLGFLRHGRMAYFNEHEYATTGHISILPYWLLALHANIVGFTCESVDFAGTPIESSSIAESFKRIFINIISKYITALNQKELIGGATVIVLKKS